VIKTINLTKKFDKIIAVNNLNLEINQGEIFGFLGPNGAGKTTTIKLLTGLLTPTSGDGFIDGYSIRGNPIKVKEVIGYIPDQPYLYPKLTGEEFLQFVAQLYGIENSNPAIIELLETFKLVPYKDNLIESYSHGMCQKLVIASCLLHNPKVIFVDEPMVGLDPKSIRLVKDIFRKNSKRGVTIFMSTHTLDLAQDLCTRMGIINEGRLIALGTMDELRKTTKGEELEDVFLQLTKEVSGLDKSGLKS